MFKQDTFQELLFYAKAFKDRYGPIAQLEKVAKENGELITAINEWLTDWRTSPITGIHSRSTYEPIVEETIDVFIMCLAVMLIFEDTPMWQQKLLEKTRQWREHLEMKTC